MLKKLMPVALPLVLAACQTTRTEPLPDAAMLTAAANSGQSIRNANPGSVVTDYTHREPVDPKPWRRLNEDQAPSRGAGS